MESFCRNSTAMSAFCLFLSVFPQFSYRKEETLLRLPLFCFISLEKVAKSRYNRIQWLLEFADSCALNLDTSPEV